MRLSGRRWIVWAAGLLLLVAAAATVSCQSPRPGLVLTVEHGDLVERLVASGRIATPRRVHVGSQVAGRVERVLHDEGEQVTAGATLLTLDAAEAQALLAQAVAERIQAQAAWQQLVEVDLPMSEQQLRQAQTDAAQAETHWRRLDQLARAGAHSRSDRDEAARQRSNTASRLETARVQVAALRPEGAAAQLARARVSAAQAREASAQARLAQTVVTAPVTGLVLSRQVEPGSVVQPGAALFTLTPQGDLRALVQIDEKHLAQLAVGQAAVVSADAYPDERLAARLTRISAAVDAQRGAIEVELTLTERADYIRQDMTVSADIEVDRHAMRRHLPAAALITEAGGTWVMAVRAGRTHRVVVETGARTPQRVEIRTRLANDEQILANPRGWREGERVRPVQAG